MAIIRSSHPCYSSSFLRAFWGIESPVRQLRHAGEASRISVEQAFIRMRSGVNGKAAVVAAD